MLDLSVIIPVGPGDEDWRELLPLLANLPKQTELIISGCEPVPEDWSEWNRSSTLAQTQWLISPKGRAQQLNHGVERSQGRMLWLLHADSRPDRVVIDAVSRQSEALQDRWCYFDLHFARESNQKMMLNQIGANLRSRIFQLPFGDQGWLLSRSIFDRVGPFDTDWARGEDLEWALRAKRYDVRPVRIGQKLSTSARRYITHGWLRTTWDHQIQMWRMIRAARLQHRKLP